MTTKPRTAKSRADRPSGGRSLSSERRTDLIGLAAELFAVKGFRATTVREIADAAGILSGSLYHHFDSKESIGDEILQRFLDAVLTDYRSAVADGGDPRAVLQRIVRSTFGTVRRHRAAVMMLQNDWAYFSEQPRFEYLNKTLREVEQVWTTQLDLGKRAGIFRADLDPKLTYRMLRDTMWISVRWYRPGGKLTTDQVADAFLGIVFGGITAVADPPKPARRSPARRRS